MVTQMKNRIIRHQSDKASMFSDHRRMVNRLAVVMATITCLMVTTAVVRANGPIVDGDDLFSTPCGGGTYDYQPIPSGFFTSLNNAASLAYTDGVDLGGDPILIDTVQVGDVDTIVRRKATSNAFGVGSSETVDIEIVALQLTSCRPITVSYADGSSEDWNVDVCLNPPQTLGSMTLKHECGEGGSYTSFLPVNVTVTFTRVGGGANSPVSVARTLDLDSIGWWVHQDPGFGLIRLDPGDLFDSVCDGVVDKLTTNTNPADFYAGLHMSGCFSGPLGNVAGGPPGDDCCDPASPQCSDPVCEQCVGQIDPSCIPPSGFWHSECADLACEACQDQCICCAPPPGPIVVKPKLNPEQAQLAAHGVVTANPEKLSGGGGPVPTRPCCKPATFPGKRCIDVDPTECVDLYQGTVSNGTNCQDTTCTNDPIYENWVIADDFCIECAECQCDVNGDGQCNQQDLVYLAGCVASPAIGCDNADLNCDGIVDATDAAVIQCLFSGQPQDVCCEQPRPLIDRVRWYGSYLDFNFEPGLGNSRIDSWLIALHSDIPATACPPTPPGTVPFDHCGTLSDCSGVGDFLFTVKGSNVQYALALDPNGALQGHVSGDMIRVCGYIDHSLTSPCLTGVAMIHVNSVLDCGTEVSRPDRLLAQWMIDAARVPIDPTGKKGWDDHNIFCYTADLPDACLVHNNADPGEIDSDGNFHPKPNKTYWISFQAAVGHTVDAACNEIATGQTVNKDYWGVHTTPPGYQRKDDAYAGTLKMGCPPDNGVCDLAQQVCISGPFAGATCTSDADCSIHGEWVYDWMHHLHCSDPLYRDCCQDPTKSIDIAYYLLRKIPGTCSDTSDNAGDQCTTDADCPGGFCTTSESIRWCQPINPGPPTTPTPVPSPIPPDFFRPGIDEFTETSLFLVFNYLGATGLKAQLTGPTIVTRASPPANSTTTRTIPTEMVQMDLSGVSPLGGTMTVRAGRSFDLPPSLGQIAPSSSCCSFDSFFDVFVEIEILSLQLHTIAPIRIQAQIYEIPPSNVSYTLLKPVDLFDADEQIVGQIKFVDHFIPYNGGVNIHSDVDWANTPTEVCCEPNADGTACVGTCPDPDDACLATATLCDANGVNCVITKCDCLDPPPPPEDCHIVDDPDLFPPFDCVGICPSPPWPLTATCNRIELDVDGDGVIDTIDCRCEGEPEGACCDEFDNTCFIALQTDCTLPLQTFHPNEDCDPMGSCCIDTDGDGFPDGCIVLAEVCCKDKPNSTFHPNFDCGQTPLLVNLCCYDKDGDGLLETCDDLPKLCCNDIPGSSFHAGTTCGFNPTGECCYDSNNDGIPDKCELTKEPCCEDSGGTWHDSNTCAQIGACCYDSNNDGVNDSCKMLSRNCCDDISPTNTWTPGLTCVGTQQPCCVNRKCTMMDPTCCQGTIGALGTACSADEACCDPDTGTCIDVDPLCCPGNSQGVGTTCSAFTEACCYPDESCADLDRQCCDDTGGTVKPGFDCLDEPCGQDLPCEPTLDQQACNDTVCPNVAEKCDPSLIACDATGCRVLECECTTECHIDFDVSVPFCVNDCPPGQECALFGQDVDGDGTRDIFWCDCIDPPACKPSTTQVACDPYVCPDPNEFCRPKVISQPRFCFQTNTKCLTDADCTGTFCEKQTEIITCECGPDDECHIEIAITTADPICVGACPANTTCIMKREDTNNNGFADLFECICVPIGPTPTPNPTGINMNRAIAFILESGQGSVAGVSSNFAIRIIMEELHVPDPPNPDSAPAPDFSAYNGKVRWVGAPNVYPEFGNPNVDPLFLASYTQCEPHFRNWFASGLDFIIGSDVVPSSTLILQVVHENCPDLENELCYTEPVFLFTSRWGDLVTPFNPPDGSTQPDINDVLAEVGKWLSKLNPVKPISQIQPHVPNPSVAVSIDDVLKAVNAWLSGAYPYTGPCDCPSTTICTTSTECVVNADCAMMEICATSGYCTMSVDLCKRCSQP